MKKKDLPQKYYDTQCEQIRQLIFEECKTVEQRTAVCAKVLECCNVQLTFLEEQFPTLDSVYTSLTSVI